MVTKIEIQVLANKDLVRAARTRLSKAIEDFKAIFSYEGFNRLYIHSNENIELLSLLISPRLTVTNPIAVFVLGGTAITLSEKLKVDKEKSWFVDFNKLRVEAELKNCANIPSKRIFHQEILYLLSNLDEQESESINFIYLSNILDWLYWYWSHIGIAKEEAFQRLVQIIVDIKTIASNALLTITSCELEIKKNLLKALKDRYIIFQDFNSIRQSEKKGGPRRPEHVVLIGENLRN